MSELSPPPPSDRAPRPDPGPRRSETARPRRRPGRLWLFFYGRKRRGFPGLLVGLVVAAFVLGLVYGLPGGADLSRWFIVLTVAALVALILGSLALVVVSALRGSPPRGRPRGRR